MYNIIYIEKIKKISDIGKCDPKIIQLQTIRQMTLKSDVFADVARQNKTVIIQRSLSMTMIIVVIGSSSIVDVHGDLQRIVPLP